MAERAQETEARRAILSAIRQHLAASAPFDAARGNRHEQHEMGTRASSAASREQAACEQAASLVERFRQALEAVGGCCAVVHDESEAAQAVERIVERKNAQRIAVSDSPLAERVIGRAKSDAALLRNASASALFDCELSVTSAQWAVSETGTLVLESDQERHRLSSLVPPAHIAIIEAGRIRQTLADVLQAMSDKGQDLSRAVTFITGPSRTSDIELTLAIGVHGPAEVYVIIIEGEGHD